MMKTLNKYILYNEINIVLLHNYKQEWISTRLEANNYQLFRNKENV